MTPLASMWLASLVGAALFFASGFFLARRHSTLAAAVDAVVPPRVPPPVVDSPPATAAADPVHAEGMETLRAQVNDLRNALREARVREQGHADIERELLRLRAERAHVEQNARRELAIELEAARRRLGEVGQVHEENAALRRQVAELSADRDRLSRAEAELRDLRARQVAASPPPRVPRPIGSGTLRPAGDPRSTAEQLSGLLARVRGKSMRAIALADDLGLPIVGLGDETSSLAAFAGYLTEIGRKTRDFLPMAALRRVTIEDENETTVTACPHAAGDAHIALVTLTAGAGPSARQMGDVLRSAASLVR
jgi:hypothetical protein